MKFFAYTASTHVASKPRNHRLTQVIILIFTTSMFFFGHLQIATAQTVHIPDPSLRTVIEAALGKAAGEDITQADMVSLESLQSGCSFLSLSGKGLWWVPERWICQSTGDASEYGIQDLTGLEFAVNLTELHLGNNKISDVSPLKSLTKLTYLDVGRNDISDVFPLKDLTNLTHLSLGRNDISDVSPLKDLTNLTHLSLIHNSVSDISALKDLTELIELDLLDNKIPDISVLIAFINLTHLSLRSNKISDISALKDLTNLTYLSLRDNKISDVSALKGLTNLTYLHIGFNYRLSDISPLKSLTNLIHLDFDENEVSDVSALKDLTNLKHLDASDNRILDLSPLKDLTNLTWLDLDGSEKFGISPILDISALKDLANLRYLDLHHNKISDVSALKDLENLKELYLNHNEISDVSPLKDLTNLTILNLSSNHISDFSPLAGLIENLTKYNTRNQTFPTYRSEDVNRDGVVNIVDLVLIASNFDDPDLVVLAEMNIYPDVNGDGVVDLIDLLFIASEIGAAAAPTVSEHSVDTSPLSAVDLREWIRLSKALDTQDVRIEKGISVLMQLLSVLTAAESLPQEIALLVNYPNPFNPETWIPYELSKSAEVSILIYSIDGKVVRRLELGRLPAGMYRSKSRAAYWDGRNGLGESVASGLYFYTLIAGNFTASRKMLIRK